MVADRAVFLTLEPIPEERRRPEVELWAAFEAECPRILGVLLDAMVRGLKRLPTAIPMLAAKGRRFATGRAIFRVITGRSRSPLHIRPYSSQLARSNTGKGNRMNALTAKDAKCGFGPLIELARAELTLAVKRGRRGEVRPINSSIDLEDCVSRQEGFMTVFIATPEY